MAVFCVKGAMITRIASVPVSFHAVNATKFSTFRGLEVIVSQKKITEEYRDPAILNLKLFLEGEFVI